MTEDNLNPILDNSDPHKVNWAFWKNNRGGEGEGEGEGDGKGGCGGGELYGVSIAAKLGDSLLLLLVGTALVMMRRRNQREG